MTLGLLPSWSSLWLGEPLPALGCVFRLRAYPDIIPAQTSYPCPSGVPRRRWDPSSLCRENWDQTRVSTHAELQHRNIQYLRARPPNVWSCVQTPASVAVVQIRIPGDCFQGGKAGNGHHADTGITLRKARSYQKLWAYRCDNMATSNIPISRLWVLHLFGPHINQELPSLGDALEPGWRIMVNYNLHWDISRQIGSRDDTRAAYDCVSTALPHPFNKSLAQRRCG